MPNQKKTKTDSPNNSKTKSKNISVASWGMENRKWPSREQMKRIAVQIAELQEQGMLDDIAED